MDELTNQAVATLLVSLRIVPALGFAPPFTLLRIPGTVRMLLAISLAGWLVLGNPAQTWQHDFQSGGLFAAALAELVMGIGLALALQFAFAALLVAGRAIDIQAGFGFASMLDPTTRAQTPLTGMLFAYAAAAIFFAIDGPADLLAIWAASVEQVPIGAASSAGSLAPLTAYISAVFVLTMGAGGLAMLVLFLIDFTIAFMSRTLPQMNVLMFGFQVKTLALMVMLPVAIALSLGLFVRMLRYALQTAAELI